MTKLLMTCGAAMLLAACASQPATTGSTASPAATTSAAAVAASAPTKDKLICEDSEQIGSHFHSRVCLTPEQVEARRKATQDALRLQDSTSGQGGLNSIGPPR